MGFDLYRQMIDELDCVDKVCLGQYGEPLLYPALAAAIAYAKRAGKYVWTTTNAQALDENRSHELLNAGLDKIIFSIDHIDKENFERFRVHLDWESVNANIDRFVQLRNMGHYKTAAVVNVVISPDATESDDDYRRFWSGRVDGVAFTNEADVSIVTGTAAGNPVNCERPFDHITIRVDGTVVLCCRDCHMVHTFGNVNDAPPLDIFNSENFEFTRARMKEGCGYPAMCNGCRTFWPDYRQPVRAGDGKI
jgi:MoaA/NifB/PqqE/SkfB family radical SAM enzyme